MMKTNEAQTKQKRIEDLTLHELDMVYSLMQVQDWPDSEIGRVYKLTVDDVHKIFDSYRNHLDTCALSDSYNFQVALLFHLGGPTQSNPAAPPQANE